MFCTWNSLSLTPAPIEGKSKNTIAIKLDDVKSLQVKPSNLFGIVSFARVNFWAHRYHCPRKKSTHQISKKKKCKELA